MPETKFSKQLKKSSSALLECGQRIEDELRMVLDRAENCDPEIAVVTAHALTKLTLDIGAAPLFISKQMQSSGQEMRDIIEILHEVLHKARPDQVKDKTELAAALQVTFQACQKRAVKEKIETLFSLLVEEIAKVYTELRAILKRKRDSHTKMKTVRK